MPLLEDVRHQLLKQAKRLWTRHERLLQLDSDGAEIDPPFSLLYLIGRRLGASQALARDIQSLNCAAAAAAAFSPGVSRTLPTSS